MSTPEPLPAEASPRGGPNTPEGKAISSMNAVTHGLFTARDFVRPGEETLYSELAESLNEELVPNGPLELNLVEEIRRAMWRLRRCGEVESHLVIGLDDGRGYIFDPMETANAAAEKVQKSVDRARSQAHRLLHKCAAELRKLQTERATPVPKAAPGSFCKTGIHSLPAPSPTPRNAECPCGSGMKHKR